MRGRTASSTPPRIATSANGLCCLTLATAAPALSFTLSWLWNPTSYPCQREQKPSRGKFSEVHNKSRLGRAILFQAKPSHFTAKDGQWLPCSDLSSAPQYLHQPHVVPSVLHAPHGLLQGANPGALATGMLRQPLDSGLCRERMSLCHREMKRGHYESYMAHHIPIAHRNGLLNAPLLAVSPSVGLVLETIW